MWPELKELGGTEPVEHYAMKGYVDVGGHTHAVFDGPMDVRLVIRPWQDDMMPVLPEGQRGHTPGFKVYASAEYGLSRDDRIEWNGGSFRLMNPQLDELWALERWDMQTDERAFRHIDDVPEEYLDEMDKPEHTFGDW